ncbi:phage portal protein [Candidatus Sumerlaeota bacterium]|nr:phage portal protein [Candidatus Sumerlaeota bacterium]
MRLRKVRASILTTLRKSISEVSNIIDSRKIADEDEFEKLYEQGMAIAPPYPLRALARLIEYNNTLEQCISAMEINCESFGHTFVLKNEELAKKNQERVEEEWKQLDGFFKFVNPRESFIDIRRKTRRDLELLGNAYWEILRNSKGEIAGIEYLPAVEMRICPQDKEPVKVEIKTIEETKIAAIKVSRRFRKYVQVRNQRKVWFKEFGDPRPMNYETGERTSVPNGKEATEVLHLRLHNASASPYGLPRWIGQLPDLIGSRKAQEVNLLFFDNKSIPPLVIMVSGGHLTKQAIKKLEDFFATQLKGVENFHNSLILEAEPFQDTALPEDKIAPVKIEILPLEQYIKEDALFQGYIKLCQKNLLSAFRLPPIYVGASDDYNRATSQSARRIAEEQVFAPERHRFDWMINRFFLQQEMGIRFWEFRSRGPSMMDVQLEKAKAIAQLVNSGAVTPNELRDFVGDLLGKELEPMEYDFADVPINVYLQMGGIMPQKKMQKSVSSKEELIQLLKTIRSRVLEE